MSSLAKRSDIYQYAIDQASIVSITNCDGKITYVNDNFCRISGYKREELLGCDHRILTSSYHSKNYFKKLWDKLLSGQVWVGEICNKSKNGDLYWVNTNIIPILNIKGDIVEFISIRHDITESKKVENSFKEEIQTLDFILDSYEAGMFQYFFKEKKIKFNQNFLKILNVKSLNKDSCLNDFLNILAIEDQKKLNQMILDHLEGKSDSFEYFAHLRVLNSETRSIKITGKVLRVSQTGDFEVLVGFITDLTVQENLEKLLQRTQQIAKIGAWEITLGDSRMSWSPSNYEIYGHSPHHFDPTNEKYKKNIICEEFKNIYNEVIADVTATRKVRELDIKVIRANGEKIWVRHTIHADCVDGEVYKLYGTTQDINDQKLLALDLNDSTKKVNMALETAGFGIGEIDHKNRRIFLDDFLKELLGLSHVRGRVHLKDIQKSIVKKDFEDLNLEYAKAISKSDAIVNHQFRVVKENGIIHYIQTRGIIDYDINGKPNGILGLFWDISKDKEFERILIETKDKAQAATEMKSEFLASMSHEIRTPMNGVLGMLELLSDTNLSSEQLKIVDTMKNCSDSLLTVVNDVLDFSKIEAGKIEFEHRKFDLIAMLEKISTIFNITAQEKGLKLNLKLDKSLPRYIKMDEVRLKQVLNNLVSNAIKFTHKGEINIIAYSNRADFKESNVESVEGLISFIIKDTGIGIESCKMDKLFASFSQVDSSTTRKYGGSGLGLVISKSLIEMMGGDIDVKSKIGEGSTFKFNFLCPFFRSKNNIMNKKAKSFHYRKDLEILVAEDNIVNQTLIKAIFLKMGFIIDIAINGKMACEAVKKKKYDVVFMDLQMPLMDGLEATKSILTDSGLEVKPLIIALTANVFQEDKNRCLSIGMRDFVSKPVSRKELLKVLSRYFPDYESVMLEVENKMEENKSQYTLINTDQILFEFEDDLDIFEELFDDYQACFSRMINEIKNGIQKGSSEEVRIAAHTLKGVVANFYSDKLTDSANKMELSGKEGNIEVIAQQLNDFLNYNDGVLAELFHFLLEQKQKESADIS